MEPACLRVKFTPLLKETQKSSETCCLEIVPEVSYIQNLEKLTWKQERNYIEYTIPMTYKIILRKPNNNKNISDNIIKTYHSCVDLLLSSSKSNVDLGSGDVSKIISDTFILNKIRTSISKLDVINVTTHNDKLSEIIQSDIPSDDATLDVSEETITVVEEEVINDEATKPESQECNEISVDKTLCDKPTSTENISTMFTSDITCEPGINISGQLALKPRLSVSPICSINTYDTALKSITNAASKGITCQIHESQKELTSLGCISNLSESIKEDKISTILSRVGNLSENNSTRGLQFPQCDRSPPEIRIAQYVNYMENELLSLNVTLDELITKCTVLGVYEGRRKVIKSSRHNFLFYKSVCMYNNHITTEIRERSTSNRAVYSIVFDG